MTQTDLTAYHQDIYNALLDSLDRIKKAPGRPDGAAIVRVQLAIEAQLIIRDELRRLLPPEPEPVQVSLLDTSTALSASVPRRGGY